MGRSLRRIIRIDEEKCDGCGICADACHEGAIQIVNGKAKLVKESYCDGLGDCIGPCPQNAISFEERVAQEYNEEAVKEHFASAGTADCCTPLNGSSCPGSTPMTMEPAVADTAAETAVSSRSELTTWPVQITLVPPSAPFLANSDLLITADCVPFAIPDFHRRFLRGRIALVGCPKLDDAAYYLDKFTEIFRSNSFRSITVVYMEVPCCGGLPRLVTDAMQAAGREFPLELLKLGIQGDILDRQRLG